MARRISRKHAARGGGYIARAEQETSKQPTATGSVPPPPSDTSNAGEDIISNGRAMNPSTIAFAVIVSILSIALFIVLGSWAYRNRKQKERQKRASSFNQAAFTEKKDPFALLTGQRFEADLTNNMRLGANTFAFQEKSWSRSNVVSHIETDDAVSGDRTPNTGSTFRVTNGLATSPPAPITTFPTVPSPVADKQRTSRAKPKSLDISKFTPEEMTRSPPPSYNLGDGQDVFIPIPTMLPPEKAKAAAMPPTPPVTSSKFSTRSGRSRTSQLTVAEGEPNLVTSPARSESFAAKDIEIPVSAATTSPTSNALKSLPITLQTPNSASSTASSRQSPLGGVSPRLPRMMTVIATYIPNLADELEVQVGDTVRVLQQYKDGWCFAQQIGKIDSPRGVVPMICLRDRQRMVPLSIMSSKSSIESIKGWK